MFMAVNQSDEAEELNLLDDSRESDLLRESDDANDADVLGESFDKAVNERIFA